MISRCMGFARTIYTCRITEYCNIAQKRNKQNLTKPSGNAFDPRSRGLWFESYTSIT